VRTGLLMQEKNGPSGMRLVPKEYAAGMRLVPVSSPGGMRRVCIKKRVPYTIAPMVRVDRFADRLFRAGEKSLARAIGLWKRLQAPRGCSLLLRKVPMTTKKTRIPQSKTTASDRHHQRRRKLFEPSSQSGKTAQPCESLVRVSALAGVGGRICHIVAGSGDANFLVLTGHAGAADYMWHFFNPTCLETLGAALPWLPP